MKIFPFIAKGKKTQSKSERNCCFFCCCYFYLLNAMQWYYRSSEMWWPFQAPRLAVRVIRRAIARSSLQTDLKSFRCAFINTSNLKQLAKFEEFTSKACNFHTSKLLWRRLIWALNLFISLCIILTTNSIQFDWFEVFIQNGDLKKSFISELFLYTKPKPNNVMIVWYDILRMSYILILGVGFLY